MKKIIFLLLLAVCNITTVFATSPLVAFPGADGFGKYAVGGRGGKVVAVTNLVDYLSTETPIVGSFRWALNQYVNVLTVDKAGVPTVVTEFTPLTIVFKVSGTIWLKEDLKVKRDSLTIAGQTAPGDGICIAGRSVLFNGATGGEMFYWGPRRKDVIVRYIRFRTGYPKNTDGTPLISSSIVTYGTDMENYENVIFDHCSISWANEECFATYDTKNVTVQWSIISEGLYCAYHKKGLRSYGGVWGGQFASYHHNLLTDLNGRCTRFDGSRAHDTLAVIDYHNNVIYNWGLEGCYGGEIYDAGVSTSYTDSTGVTRYFPAIYEIFTSSTGKTYYKAAGKAEINMVNNYYKPGPATASGVLQYRLVYLDDRYQSSFPASEKGKVYATGNVVAGNTAVTTNNWAGGIQLKYYTPAATFLDSFKLAAPSPELPNMTISPATDAFTDVLAGAGATLPLRDAHDKRLVFEAQNGTASGSGTIKTYTNGSTYTNSTYYGVAKGIIDDPDAVGGWPIFTTGTVPTDTDGDGIPDDYEIAHGLNPTDSIDGSSIAASGYSNLEEYLNNITTFQNFLQAPFNLKASLNGSNKPQLTWQDVSDAEDNYVIERAPTGTTDFVAIDTIAANSSSFVDASANGAIYVYRVRAITTILQSAYSNTVEITVPTIIQENQIKNLKVYPNPVVKSLNIEAAVVISQVELYSVTGALVGKVQTNSNQVVIPMETYVNGVYTVKITAKDGTQTCVKLIK